MWQELQAFENDKADKNHTHFLILNSKLLEVSSEDQSSSTSKSANLILAPDAAKKNFQNTQHIFALELLMVLYRMSSWIKPENQEEQQKLDSTFIPVIGILVQGDMHTAHTCVNYLMKQVPILVIEGTGGCADLIAYAFNQLKFRFNMQTSTAMDLRKEYITTTLAPALRARISGSSNQATAYVCLVLQCALLAYQSNVCLLTVLCANAKDRPLQYLPEYLLEKYLESTLSKHHHHKQREIKEDLRLALAWNSCRIAHQLLLNCNFQFKDMSHILLYALATRGRHKFVRLLLRSKFCVRHILKHSEIGWLMKTALQSNLFRIICCEGMLGLNLSKNAKLTDKFLGEKLVRFVNRLLYMTIELSDFFSTDDLSTQLSTPQCCLEQKGLLFLSVWAVCTGRYDLVHAFWPLSTYPLQILLLVAHTLQEMSSFANDFAIREKLNKQFDKFVALAVDLLNDCSIESHNFATKALSSTCVHFNRYTPIGKAYLLNKRFSCFCFYFCCLSYVSEMAAKLSNFDFVTHSSSQKLLEHRLMLGMHLSGSQFGEVIDGLKLLLCVLLVFPIRFWVDAKQNFSQRIVLGDFETISIFQRWLVLIQTPATKYWLSQLFYVLLLVLFTLVVIQPLHNSFWLDICVFISLLTIHMENVRCLFCMRKFFLRPSWKDWLEQLIMITFVCFIFVHSLLPSTHRFHSVEYDLRMMCVLALIYHYMKYMGIFMPMYSKLGPLFYQIKLLSLGDLFLFMVLCWPFVVGFGVIIEVALYPDRESWHGNNLREMFHRSILTVFQSPYDEVRADNKQCDQHHSSPFVNNSFCRISNYDDVNCNNRGVFSNVFFLGYGLLLKIVLLALLYALFNTSMINLKWITIWRFQRYELVRSFEIRSILPPPFTPIAYAINLVRALFQYFYTKKNKIQDNQSNQCDDCIDVANIYFWKCVCQKTLGKFEAKDR